MNFFAVMALPLLACLLLVLIHPALGQHVLARGVIFVDLALAQIAALGQSVAFLLGADPHDASTYYWSFGFTLLGAALFSFLWDREHSVLQEAFIGISFALATAERMTFSTMPLARCLENLSMAMASSTSRPRIRSITSRALRGAMRAKR